MPLRLRSLYLGIVRGRHVLSPARKWRHPGRKERPYRRTAGPSRSLADGRAKRRAEHPAEPGSEGKEETREEQGAALHIGSGACYLGPPEHLSRAVHAALRDTARRCY